MSANATFVIPAKTVKYTYDFTNANTTIITSGPSSKDFGQTKARIVDSNGVEQGDGSGLASIGVTASAWNITKNTANSNFTVAAAVVGQYVGGLGITAPTPYDNSDLGACGNGQCGTHQIDSQGSSQGSVSTDVLQLVFTQAVTLGSVTRNAYGLVTAYSGGNYYYSYDDDMSWGQGTGTGLSTTSAMTQAQYNALWSGFDNGACAVGSTAAAGGYKGCQDTDGVRSQADASNATYSSKVWYISAGAALASFSGQDSIADAFKVGQITAFGYTPAVTIVPEPASWAMMVLGFGVVGSAIRRRRAAERAAEAAAA